MHLGKVRARPRLPAACQNLLVLPGYRRLLRSYALVPTGRHYLDFEAVRVKHRVIDADLWAACIGDEPRLRVAIAQAQERLAASVESALVTDDVKHADV